MKPIQDTHLYREIHQQPEVIRNLIDHTQGPIETLAEEILARGIRHIFIAARGTSDNAGRYAKYLLGAQNHLDVSLATPSLFTIYGQPPTLTDSLVLGISQSGKSPDIVSVLQEGKKQGALTAAITNIPKSDLGRAADIVMDLQAGEEHSLAATKTYTAQLTTLALLSTALAADADRVEQLTSFPTQVEALLETESTIKELVERYRYMNHCIIIGRGLNYATAFEFALKLKELTYTIAEPYSSADFLHGPVALVDRGFPVFVIGPSGQMVPEMLGLVEKVRERDAEVMTISDNEDLLGLADRAITLPAGVPEWLSPISVIVPAQIFALYLAHTRGFDVDLPRGLHKVTETW
ncbi:MAG: SIS domain-containing protein [Chloroflexota bacterium]|nr:SIS domain-containing protein [Chloroflexota bacterium]